MGYLLYRIKVPGDLQIPPAASLGNSMELRSSRREATQQYVGELNSFIYLIQ